MSATNNVEKKDELPKDGQVQDVVEKMENLNVDNKEKANEEQPSRRPARSGRGGFRGRNFRGRGGMRPRFVVPYEEFVKKIEEEQSSKKVIEEKVKGYVKWYSIRDHYGFLARDDSQKEGDDVFVHQTAIAKSSTVKIYFRTLADNEPVVFDIVEGRKGKEAANVTGPDGENVRGSRFARSYFGRFKSRFYKKKIAHADDAKDTVEGGDAEVKSGKRRPRRGRGAPKASENGDAKNGEEEKGNGDGQEEQPGKKRRTFPSGRNRKPAAKKNQQKQNDQQPKEKPAVEALQEQKS